MPWQFWSRLKYGRLVIDNHSAQGVDQNRTRNRHFELASRKNLDRAYLRFTSILQSNKTNQRD